MMNIYYKSVSLFHKAIRRNNVNYVYYDSACDNFWFWTQKAIINYITTSDKETEVLKTWFVTHGVEIRDPHYAA